MKKGTGKFYKPSEITIDVCDNCEKEISLSSCVTYNYEWSDGYDSYGDKINTCSLMCLYSFIQKEYDEDSLYLLFPDGETVSLHLPSDAMKNLLNGV